MAHIDQIQITQFTLTLSDEEAAILRGVLSNVVIQDKNFSDDEDGEAAYDELSGLLVGIHEALVEAGAPSTYDTFDFEII